MMVSAHFKQRYVDRLSIRGRRRQTFLADRKCSDRLYSSDNLDISLKGVKLHER